MGVMSASLSCGGHKPPESFIIFFDVFALCVLLRSIARHLLLRSRAMGIPRHLLLRSRATLMARP
jgi:hypothetical protein